MLFSFHTNNTEIKSKQWFPLSGVMHATLSSLREGFSKHSIFTATCLKLMALTILTIKQEANAKACGPRSV